MAKARKAVTDKSAGEEGYTAKSAGKADYTATGMNALAADAAIPPADRVVTAEKVEILAASDCKPNEAASWFDLSVKDFRARLREMGLGTFWTRAAARGRAFIHIAQFRQADTSPSMALHLGRTRLGQTGADGVESGITLIVDTGIRRDDPAQD